MSGTDADSLLVQLARPRGDWVDVGLLRHRGETSWFETLPEYWSLDERPVLGQLFEERGPAWRPSSRVRLPTWFSHLLPEGQLRDAVAAAAHVNREREFFLLRRIGGDDLPGALRTTPVVNGGEGPAPEVAGEHLENRDEAMGPLKFSLAGIQLKFSVRRGSKGLTIPAHGEAGDWIVKLPDRRHGFDGVPQAEFAGLELARRADIAVPHAQLVRLAEVEGLPEWAGDVTDLALSIKRFDRKGAAGRVHVEELAQVFDVSTGREHARYDSINFETVARVTSALCGPDAVADVVDRIVLNVLLGNGDAHAKNWAYCYPDGRNAELSPAYDIVPTVLYLPDDDLGLNLAGSKSFQHVTSRAFERLADHAGWDGTLGRERAGDAVARVLDAWPVLDDHLAPDAVRRLTVHRDTLPLVKAT